MTFSFLKRVLMLPSSLSTRRRSCSLFWQLRTSLMKTERPLIPDKAISSDPATDRQRNGCKDWNPRSIYLGSALFFPIFFCFSSEGIERERERRGGDLGGGTGAGICDLMFEDAEGGDEGDGEDGPKGEEWE